MFYLFVQLQNLNQLTTHNYFTAIVFHLFVYFLPWIRIRILNTVPDPVGHLKTDPIWIRIQNTDQHTPF